MPQLPSGREIGLQPERLEKLYQEAWEGRFVHEFMMIENTRDLLPYIDIVELKPAVGGRTVQLDPRSQAEGKAFHRVGSQISLDKVHLLAGAWPAGDIAALGEFLASERARKFLDHALARIREGQQRILAEAHPLARMQAVWWREGCHPLQEEGESIDDFRLREHAEELARGHIAAGSECEDAAGWDKAIEHYRLALALDPRDPEVVCSGHDNLARCLLRLGRFGEAAVCLVNAARLAPDGQPAWLSLQQLLADHPELAELPEVKEGVKGLALIYDTGGGAAGQP